MDSTNGRRMGHIRVCGTLEKCCCGTLLVDAAGCVLTRKAPAKFGLLTRRTAHDCGPSVGDTNKAIVSDQ